MKCLFCNIRGVGRSIFVSSTKILIKMHSIDVCVFFEPRTSGEKAIAIARKLGFIDYLLEEARGFFGGIWICWNNNDMSIEIVASTSQTVTAIVNLNNTIWALTAVYGSSNPGARKELWSIIDKLVVYIENYKLPWVLVGDFNEILCLFEKRGGNATFTNTGFSDSIHRNTLIDMVFYGTKFTWVSSTTGVNPIRERLDRGLCNTCWKHSFPECYISTLPRVKFDHNPLLLSLYSLHHPDPQHKPFRFYSMWMEHGDFDGVVNEGMGQ